MRCENITHPISEMVGMWKQNVETEGRLENDVEFLHTGISKIAYTVCKNYTPYFGKGRNVETKCGNRAVSTNAVCKNYTPHTRFCFKVFHVKHFETKFGGPERGCENKM